ncbi:hypothetical protein KJD09_02405 [Borreliella valaisiana]|uniref:Uncharacterized protein n=1 Tax=Borreliella valaisiana VS116 TaxID=445987 RepID=D6RXW2_BORVA|nr:hypothetical protein BVAVS116_0483 [Borreliella valaisiana VS116]WVN14575.1 hypothetical protein KJD09_02405 [Borreliella valaisiana]
MQDIKTIEMLGIVNIGNNLSLNFLVSIIFIIFFYWVSVNLFIK